MASTEDYVCICNLKPGHVNPPSSQALGRCRELAVLFEARGKDALLARTRDTALIGVLYCGEMRRTEVAALMWKIMVRQQAQSGADQR